MERRKHARHDVHLPVELRAGIGRTHDMSVSGAYIETAEFDVPVGARFEFAITIGRDAPGPMKLRCRGLVIRIDRRGDRIGIAASIDRFLEVRPQTSGSESNH